jgi:hypothetical protein
LDAARRVLGTTTETETIERALDLVVFGERLASGTARARGRVWNDVVGEMQQVAPVAPFEDLRRIITPSLRLGRVLPHSAGMGNFPRVKHWFDRKMAQSIEDAKRQRELRR